MAEIRDGQVPKTNMGNIKYSTAYGWYAVAIVTATLLLSSVTAAAYIATEYRTDEDMTVGSLVALGADGGIVPASVDSSNYMGVVTAQGEDAVEVATSGVVPVLVSDRQGEVKVGDRIGLSDIAGVAAKWLGGNSSVGIAKTDPKNWHEIDVASEDGTSQKIRVASVGTQLIKDEGSSQSGNPFMGALQRTADGLAGKPVATWRVIAALLIGLGGVVLSFTLLFASSRQSFFSLGRNPLASGAIMGGLWRVAVVSVIIIGASLATAYLIVRTA